MEELPFVPIKTCLPLEEHARNVLTPYAFNVAQNEIMLSMQYALTEMANGSYLVRHYKKMERECLVFWIPEDEQVHCSCKEFEHSGILCRHSLRVLVVKNYFQIPEKYFPVRWRLENSVFHLDDQIIQSNNNELSEAFHSLTVSLFQEASISKERYNYVNRALSELLEHVQNMPAPDEVVLNLEPKNASEP